MTPCKPIAALLPQHVAEGEPATPRSAALRAHLAVCPHCEAYRARLAQVEEALRHLPHYEPDPAVRARILLAIAQQPPELDRWQWLPWTVWLPALALASAGIIALAALLPPDALPLAAAQAPAIVQQLDLPAPWVALHDLTVSPEHWLSLWLGLSASMAGIGVLLASSRWNASNSQVVEQWEHGLQQTAQRITQRVRHVS